MNLGHTDQEFETITRFQQAQVFPWLKRILAGGESLVLDLGCGPGRFAGPLADLIHCRVVAVDPVQEFLQMAPRHELVDYRCMTNSTLPLPADCVDVVWICLVLGGLKGAGLKQAITEVNRVLKDGGLLFVVENTSTMSPRSHWEYRSFAAYKALMSFTKLELLSSYDDLGETISIMAGRKCECVT